MSVSFEQTFPQDVIDVVTAENTSVLVALVNYLRTHYELNAALRMAVDVDRPNVISLGFEAQPVEFLVSREFLTANRDTDLGADLDNRWFLGALIQSCKDTEIIVLDAEVVEKIRRT
jgi:hypothetical protein